MFKKSTIPAMVALFLIGPAHAQTGLDRKAPTVLFHGNYCGPGNNAPAAPIDALDAACARHDGCTPDSGLATKACNLGLQRDAEAVSRDPREPEELRTLAGLVSVGASMMMSARSPEGTHGAGRSLVASYPH
ncbi:hypothetical protein G3T14_16830 [Methylobacterium sp. BTF04]|uniref:hypothetical protein n=1 Tax=Methylobacterium sp. BTF04 TaxID=2708300 RepID=UPI0013D3AD88|nr:hypothetical protein [Methylobacterium sp. BTF04]NEU13782.1 hypothetical protein [Methylobacterium sp. BTF04]